MRRSGSRSVVVVVAAAWCACALGWPRGATEEMHKKSEEHRKMHRKSKGLLGEISTMSIMKVYPKPILREMHDFWCQEREEARVDRVESAVCDHWEDVRGGGFYMGANKSPPVDEVEEMHARGPRPSAARFFSRGAPFTPPRRRDGATRRISRRRPRRSARTTGRAASARRGRSSRGPKSRSFSLATPACPRPGRAWPGASPRRRRGWRWARGGGASAGRSSRGGCRRPR